MSTLHPIIAVTGSSGAGTTRSSHSFDWIFRHEQILAAHVDGDAFHSHTRLEMRHLIDAAERAGQRGPSHMGPEANLFEKLEALFAEYGHNGTGQTRRYVHDEVMAAATGHAPGTFTPWEDLPANTDLLFYEGLHGGVVTDNVDVARHVDLLIGVVPTINLEWIQKVQRDTRERGYSLENVQETILRRMYDYVHYIVPQFSRTHVNFQRVPIVDTSNPFIVREIPSSDETMVVVRFRDPCSVDFPYLLAMLHGSRMTRANTIVVPGGELELAMQVILTPLIRRLVDRRKELLAYS